MFDMSVEESDTIKGQLQKENIFKLLWEIR